MGSGPDKGFQQVVGWKNMVFTGGKKMEFRLIWDNGRLQKRNPLSFHAWLCLAVGLALDPFVRVCSLVCVPVDVHIFQHACVHVWWSERTEPRGQRVQSGVR